MIMRSFRGKIMLALVIICSRVISGNLMVISLHYIIYNSHWFRMLQIMEVGAYCLLCSQSLEDGREVNHVTAFGRPAIIAASIRRRDGVAATIELTNPLVVHSACRKSYTRETSIQAYLKKQCEQTETPLAATPLLRSQSDESFDFKKHCLFCGLEAKDPRKSLGLKREHNAIYHCRTLSFGERITERAKELCDEHAEQVLIRLSNTIDLVAAEGRYHNNCRVTFFRNKKPKSETYACKDEAFHCMIKFLEKNDECQYSVRELTDIMEDHLDEGVVGYSHKTLLIKLKAHFTESILVTHLPGKDSIVVFRDAFSNIVHDKWYTDKLGDQVSEKTRIIVTTSRLVSADIREMVNDCDIYPSPSSLSTMEADTVPESLKTLISCMLSPTGNRATEKKRLSIEQMILSAVRPRSYLSPFLIALGVYFYRKYDSRMMIDILHTFGMCCSYDEARRYQASLLAAETPFPDNEEAFVQFVFDNADWNVSSLDGNKSFHSMGGLKCTTPRSTTSSPYVLNVLRLKKTPSADSMGSYGHMPIKIYNKPSKVGLKILLARKTDLGRFKIIPAVMANLHLDSLWLSSVALRIQPIPGWGGFNHLVTEKDSVFHVSDVVALPFINLDPNNLSTVYTALLFAQSEASKYNRNYCIVTFDQPLFIKAVDIVAASTELSNVVARLGGFHLLMSFMGATGFIMAGSGLEELWRTVYGSDSITHMLDGHSYSRALRLHTLSAQAIITLLFDTPSALDSVDVAALNQIWSDLIAEEIGVSGAMSDPEIIQLTNTMSRLYQTVSRQSRTAKLWIQYVDQVSLMMQFVRAERSGYFSLHLHTIARMQPYLHAAGRLAYAKSSQVYLQAMEDLEEKMPPEDWEKFVGDGYFTIRRTCKFWSGVWSDMTIEQVLMRAMKTTGGLTRGRRITDSTLSQWVGAVPLCIPICEALEELSGMRCETSDQHSLHKDHAELRQARQTQDDADRNRLVGWLKSHNPFEYRDKLVSIFTGVEADSSINCDNAVTIGSEQHTQMMGQNYADLKLQKKKRVQPLSAMRATVKVRNEPLVVNEQQMLNRILAVLQTSNDLRDFVQYEFVNFAPALFDAVSMRKTAKSALNRILDVNSHLVDSHVLGPAPVVIDGGHFLHAVVWNTPCTYSHVIQSYVSYVQRHYPNRLVIVVFDGYGTQRSTKVVEQSRRASKVTSAAIAVSPQINTSTTQGEFLGNGANKTSLIKLVSTELRAVGILTRQAEADADNLIVSTALEYSNADLGVHVVSKDADVMISLLHRKPPGESIILIYPQSGGAEPKYVDIDKLQVSLGPLKEVILFAHAFTGTDTTSAAYRRGKAQACQLLRKTSTLRDAISIFYQKDVSPEEIAVAGEHFFLAWYGAAKFTTLDIARFFKLKQMIAKQSVTNVMNLAILPPTSGSAKQHSLRVYLLIQQCCGVELDCTKWGWEMRADVLTPVGSEKPSAPERLLELIFCNCKMGCKTDACKCRKGRRACTSMCGVCLGETCTNAPVVEEVD